MRSLNGASVKVRTPMYDYGYPPHVVDDLTSDRAQSELVAADVITIESPIDSLALAVLAASGLEGWAQKSAEGMTITSV